MFGLVDIHCHALSNVDDGASNEDTMKAMLDIAYENGTRAICFTPHFKTFEFADEEEIISYNNSIKISFDSAREYVCNKYPDMELFLGNEIMYHNEIFESLSRGFCKSLNDSSYLLIEFHPSVSSYDFENVVLRILRKGFTPIIAHIERYPALIKKPELVEELRYMGALMQINAQSILKFKFGKIARFLNNLLKRRQVDFVATDAHDSTNFSPNLKRSMLYVSKHHGENYAEKIFSKNPMLVLKNEKIH